MVDAGTLYIAVDKSTAAAIHSEIPGATLIPGHSSFDIYAYPCNTAAQNIPALIIAGQPLATGPLDFNAGLVNTPQEVGIERILQNQRMCQSNIYGGRFGDMFVVGSPYVITWYTVFEWGQEPTGMEIGEGAEVSFALAVHTR